MTDDKHLWPLAWHPNIPGDRPDRAKFVAPACGAASQRTQHGFWTSPMLGPQYSMWSIHHDKNNMTYHQVREGWAIGWPDPARTAVIDSLADLQHLVEEFPCTAHSEARDWLRANDPALREIHDGMFFPTLDFAAMTGRYDAIDLTEAGRQATWFTVPGTTLWDAPTVLWLTPAWEALHPITTKDFCEGELLIDLEQAVSAHIAALHTAGPSTP